MLFASMLGEKAVALLCFMRGRGQASCECGRGRSPPAECARGRREENTGAQAPDVSGSIDQSIEMGRRDELIDFKK